MEQVIIQSLVESIQVHEALKEHCVKSIQNACEIAIACLRRGNKILLCGNGGSAADAQHIAAELVGRFERTRRALPAIALTVDSSILTAVGNDFGFNCIFSRQVEALGAEDDVLIAITTSGESSNVLAAIKAACDKKMNVIILTGAAGVRIADWFKEVDHIIVTIPSYKIARIQECHITVGHVMCEAIDNAFKTRPELPSP